MSTNFEHKPSMKTRLSAGSGIIHIPKGNWGLFLKELGDQHRGCLTVVETTDHSTQEIVASQAMPLQFMELDLEDEVNPRINVIVRLDNKTLKYILFRPSHVTLHDLPGGREFLEVETVNTTTRIYFRQDGQPPAK